MKLPPNFASWNPAMRGAYLKGAKAAEARRGYNACPYKDKRKPNGLLTWSRAFQNAWLNGYDDYRTQEDPVTQRYLDMRCSR